MATVEFRVAARAHIVVDGDVCRSCTTKACVTACPANLFVPTSDGGVLFNYEQCFECGTCYMVCNKEGALTWSTRWVAGVSCCAGRDGPFAATTGLRPRPRGLPSCSSTSISSCRSFH